MQVRLVMISRMAKPEEVIVVENDQGEVIREYMKDTDAISMYKSMRETLGNNPIDTNDHIHFFYSQPPEYFKLLFPEL